MAAVARAAGEAGKFCGCIAADAESLGMVVEQGYRVIVGGADVAFLRTMSAEILAKLRSVLEKRDARAGR